jgi:MoaA/NifB/PqqE/SkfB family radical SAM enzyme
MSAKQESRPGPDYGPPRLTVELTSTCNRNCDYCLRDEELPSPAFPRDLSLGLLARVAREARDAMGIRQLMFTGGEPTLHPQLPQILSAVAELGMQCSFVTNGWHFAPLGSLLSGHRRTVSHVSFSLDGVTAESHDRWRGKGSFVKLAKAFSFCWASRFPFRVKAGIRRDTLSELENIALFSARLGAAGLNYFHYMPTSPEAKEKWGLKEEDRTQAEREIALLARIFRMPIGLDVGYFNLDPAAPCSALHGVSANLDYAGRLTLCCNLSGFRGASGREDIVADLEKEALLPAWTRLQHLAGCQLKRRAQAIKARQATGRKIDLSVGSPCLFCLHTLGKMPWDTVGDGR